MKRNDKPPCVAAYARVGSIQQLFASDGDMARYLFKELLADGQEHSTKEINDYIHEKTNGQGVDGKRLTDETIHSAIWYMFRRDHDLSYMQTRMLVWEKISPLRFDRSYRWVMRPRYITMEKMNRHHLE